jgi:ubiquinone/menaquinone biosynthesis C-methylase UbiE
MKPLTTKKLFEAAFSEIRDCHINRVLIAVFLFDFLDNLRKNNFPDNWFVILENELTKLINLLSNIADVFDLSPNLSEFMEQSSQYTNIQERTGEVYFNLWKNFRNEDYHDETYKILNERFEKNNISVSNIECALDDGCGSGRYTYALNKIGCKKIWGVDISPNSIAFAKHNNDLKNKNVQFLTCSVLELPFEDETFDFVFSNGVLHHTIDTEQGLNEIYRVLKKDGKCWLYLYGGKNSFFWDVVDFCRNLLSEIPQHYTQMVMNVFGYPPGRIFHRSDFFYVPINNRYLENEIIMMLDEAGFNNFKRLKRGTEYDWDEMIFNNPGIDPYIYGEGEMRFWLTK